MKLTKRLLSLLMAMLMLCSGMAVLANAEEATVRYTLNAENCYIDIENLEIVVKGAKVDSYDVVFTATQSDDATKTLRGLKDDENNTIFTNPVTGKTYNITGSITNDETSEVVTNTFAIEVLKSQSAPSAPVPKKITAASIEISSIVGCEYRIDGGEWGSKTVFDGLDPQTAYTIEMRFAKTATHYASPASSVTVKTLAEADPENIPALPVLADKTNKSLTVVEVEGVEFSIDSGANWQETGLFTGLKADTTYSIIARYTYDATLQEANPATAPAMFITNARDSYPADIKNCTFKASEGDNYANEAIDITVTADTASNKYNAQYGDTRYIPAYYTVGNSTDLNKFSLSSDGKTYKASFVPGEANANKTIEIKVYFVKEKCLGEEDGKTVWAQVGESEVKTYKVNVGEVHNFFTDIKNFFLGIFDFLFNTLPARINDMLKGIDMGAIMDGLNELLKGLEGIDLGGLTGGGTAA